MPDLAPPLDRARGITNGFMMTFPGVLAAPVVVAAAVLLPAVVRRLVARLMESRLHCLRNAGPAVGRLAQGAGSADG